MFHGDSSEKEAVGAFNRSASLRPRQLAPGPGESRGGAILIFGRLDAATLAEMAEYAFSTTVDIVLAIRASRKATRWERHGRHHQTLIRDGLPVCGKADVRSRAVASTPAGMTRIAPDCRIAGRMVDGPYWHVQDVLTDIRLWGFMHNDDVAWNPG